MTLIHASCVSVLDSGILLRGPSGSGKSDLALRLIDRGAMLVADDYVEIRLEAARAIARPPERLAGLIEIRGAGLIQMPWHPSVVLDLIVDLVARAEMPRMPEAETVDIAGATLPRVALHAFDASTPAKIRLLAARIATAEESRHDRAPA